MIEINGLTKYFYPLRHWLSILKKSPHPPTIALEDITLSIKKGEIFGLVGPNGAGKTTLLKILSTLILQDKGEAKVNNFDIAKEPDKVKSSTGIVTGDERSFYWRLNGRQNLEFFGSWYGLSSTAVYSRISGLSGLLDMNALNKRVGEYSTGMRQRLNLVRALLHNPLVLLMDEPTKSLDPSSAASIRRFIKEELSRRQGKTVLLATHNLKEAEELCDRVGVIKQGKLLATGTPKEMESKLLNA